MSKKTALYVLLSLAAGCTSVSAQNAKDIINLFGGFMQSAIMQATQAEWQKLPLRRAIRKCSLGSRRVFTVGVIVQCEQHVHRISSFIEYVCVG
jgi:hypothetical protein